MKNITEIDKNMGAKSVKVIGNKKTYTLPCEPFDLYGLQFQKNVGFIRMDKKIADKVSAGVSALNGNTAGGRLRFMTDATEMEIYVEMDFTLMPNMSVTGSSCFTLMREVNKEQVFERVFIPDIYTELNQHVGNYTLSHGLSGKLESYVLYFPLYNNVKKLKISFNKEANVYAGRKYKDNPPIIYYGSSITQGGCATRADNAYQAIIAKENNIDFLNLGFSGNALGEQEMAKYISKLECSALVLDYDFNAPTAEHLEKTHYAFFQTFRKAQPKTPVIMISAIFNLDMIKRKKIITDSYNKAIADGDKNVYFIDGKSLIKKDFKEIYTTDGLHPNDLGFYSMAEKIGTLLNKILKVRKK